MQELTVLKKDLKKRKDLFNKYRIINGSVSKNDILYTENIEPINIESENVIVSITQKMKNVKNMFFGKND